MHDSAYELAGDRRMTKAVRLLLEKLAAGTDGTLKEMAEGVLAGNLDLREAAHSSIYGDALSAATEPALRRCAEMDEDERRALVRRTEAELEDLLG
ncbi:MULTISPECIES: hypothetical protein [Catenuloplanes]|uniref:Uncharacterized protein n=1 Tax=Catenuloplanes niger TaxID=587534 RepID=A0AAE3ZWS5_9ACTN|nr:hypothetical protein [Catenuloplanes niger]MDR7327241.1 hypothetical protein [Catenuloplanes niger]